MAKLSKIEQILSLNAQGNDKVAIANLLKYKHHKSLISYMNRHNYIYVNDKFISTLPAESPVPSQEQKELPTEPQPEPLIQPTSATECLAESNKNTSDIPLHTSNFLISSLERLSSNNAPGTYTSDDSISTGDLPSFIGLDDYISLDLTSLYNDLTNILSPEQLYTLALLLLKDFIPTTSSIASKFGISISKEVSEQVGRIQSIKAFICRTFGKDKEGLSYFFDTHNITYTYALLHESKNIRTFLQKDMALNEYLLQLNNVDLETLRFNVSLASPFTKGLNQGI